MVFPQRVPGPARQHRTKHHEQRHIQLIHHDPVLGARSGRQAGAHTLCPARGSARPSQIRSSCGSLAQTLGRRVGGTPIDGNCLYHAVNQARGVPEPGLAAASADLRRRVTEYILSHLDTVANYAEENGVEINDLLDCVSRNGNWAGDEGDLVPRIIASVLDTTIVICQQGSEDLPVWPLEGGPGTGEITVYLDNDHYSVDPPLELERKKSKKSK